MIEEILHSRAFVANTPAWATALRLDLYCCPWPTDDLVLLLIAVREPLVYTGLYYPQGQSGQMIRSVISLNLVRGANVCFPNLQGKTLTTVRSLKLSSLDETETPPDQGANGWGSEN
jgi:hypothetical protein